MIEDQDLGVRQHRVKSVCNRHDGVARKGRSDRPLDQLIHLWVDIRSGFVHQDDRAVFPEQRASETQQLTLANRVVLTML